MPGAHVVGGAGASPFVSDDDDDDDDYIYSFCRTSYQHQKTTLQFCQLFINADMTETPSLPPMSSRLKRDRSSGVQL